MLSQLDPPLEFNRFIGRFLTQNHHAMEVLIPVTPITIEQLNDIFADEDIVLTPVLGIKSLLIEQPETGLCINGEYLAVDGDTREFAEHLAAKRPLTAAQVKSFLVCLKNSQMLTSVLNKGYWYIE